MSLMLLKSKAKKKSLLDAYKNNLVMGFSYYKLLSNYNGYCVKVRRSNDNAVQDFGFVKKKYVNLAKGATLTYSETMGDTTFITDNILGSFTTHSGTGARWIKFDLGTSYNISNINFWHYYADGRTYHDVIIQISIDNINWTNLFNNDADNSANQGVGSDAEYAESIDGKKLTLNQNARYVRLWTNGSNSNTDGHYVEVEILTYTNEWYIDVDSILAFCGTGNGFVHTWHNQFIGGNNAIQLNNSYQPQIVNSGLFKYDGLKFVTTSTYYLAVENYPAINILTPELSMYANITPSSKHDGIIFYRKDNGVNIAYGAMCNSNSKILTRIGSVTNLYEHTYVNGSNYKALTNWINKDTNGVNANVNGTTYNATVGSDINNYTYYTGIGARYSGGLWGVGLDGYLKTVVISNKSMDYNIISQF